jgi:hypothetical protein
MHSEKADVPVGSCCGRGSMVVFTTNNRCVSRLQTRREKRRNTHQTIEPMMRLIHLHTYFEDPKGRVKLEEEARWWWRARCERRQAPKMKQMRREGFIQEKRGKNATKKWTTIKIHQHSLFDYGGRRWFICHRSSLVINGAAAPPSSSLSSEGDISTTANLLGGRNMAFKAGDRDESIAV